MAAAVLAGVISAFAAPGDLDPTFGQGGIMVTSFTELPTWDYPRSIQVQPDGKIVVCGEIRASVGDPFDGNVATMSFFIARYNPNGGLDTSFGTNGKVIAPINSGDEFVGNEIALQPDGKILAVGVSGTGYDIAVNRYNSDGTLDPSFGTGGRIVTNVGTINSQAIGVSIQQDGKILVVGSAASDPFNGGLGLVRYNPNGSLDNGFGEGGKVITDFVDGASPLSIMYRPDGKIVVAGHGTGNFALARYNRDGSLDTDFGSNGKIVQASRAQKLI